MQASFFKGSCFAVDLFPGISHHVTVILYSLRLVFKIYNHNVLGLKSCFRIPGLCLRIDFDVLEIWNCWEHCLL